MASLKKDLKSTLEGINGKNSKLYTLLQSNTIFYYCCLLHKISKIFNLDFNTITQGELLRPADTRTLKSNSILFYI